MTVQTARQPAADQSIARRSTVADLLRRSAARDPGKLALVFGEVRQTFAELDATVNRATNALAERGVRRGDRVLLLAHNSHGFVVAYFALARIGAISVPVPASGGGRPPARSSSASCGRSAAGDDHDHAHHRYGNHLIVSRRTDGGR